MLCFFFGINIIVCFLWSRIYYCYIKFDQHTNVWLDLHCEGHTSFCLCIFFLYYYFWCTAALNHLSVLLQNIFFCEIQENTSTKNFSVIQFLFFYMNTSWLKFPWILICQPNKNKYIRINKHDFFFL